MPVTDVHRLYSARLAQWVRCRDAYEGTDAVKGKGTTYLPRLTAQKPQEYDAYLKRALWYGATARTVHGLAGSVMRKPPEREVAEGVEVHLQDVTRTNVSLEAFCAGLVQEVVHVGRAGVLLDMPTTPAGADVRPHWVRYDAEQIRNWRTEVINGVRTLTLVVLAEEAEVLSEDGFRLECRTQYRVLRLEGGIYTVTIYRQAEKERGAYLPDQTIVPKVRGLTLAYIPFVFFNPLNLDCDPDRPPLLDLVDVNFSHYLTSADLEHGRHYTALPTPWVTGMSKDSVLKIGSATAWCIPVAEAKVGMLEFTGQGLQALEKAMESKERQMAVLGARMLEEQKLAAETAEALSIRRSGESSVLASIAATISIGLTQVVRWHHQWVGARDRAATAKIELNKDFFGVPLSAGEIAELVRTWQAGAISYETLYYNLKQGELTRPGVDHETERAQIDNEAPTLDLSEGPGEEEPEPEAENPRTGRARAGARPASRMPVSMSR